MRIALDAMGGDHAPSSTVNGAIEFIRENGQESPYIDLYGHQDQIQKIIDEYGFNSDRISIIHCTEVVDMDERSVKAFRDKPDSSLVRAVSSVKEGNADAIVSAGNTGALLTSALFVLGKIEGINRPALAPYIPTQNGGFILCDAGANSDVKPKHLVHFGIMASAYMEHLVGIENPRVALLNIGTESSKGSELTRQAYPLMEEHVSNFIGNIESRYIMEGKADIVVCDGFVGNTMLKLIEGLIKHLFSWIGDSIKSNTASKLASPFLKPAFKEIKNILDYEEHGSTPFLGVNGIVMKCHGSSSVKSIKNALNSAAKASNENLINDIATRISKHLITNTELENV
jgi:phosphate acyltransferase